MKPRGVAQRNAGLAALKTLNPATGSFYFVYNLDLDPFLRPFILDLDWRLDVGRAASAGISYARWSFVFVFFPPFF